ncbi:MAG: DNA gyrase subunit A [Planctomycetota bacterium]
MTQDTHGIRTLRIEDEIRQSYLTYAMSVIISRALPDSRDGLKPSQRRILVAMNDLNLGPRSKHRKCAKIAGDTSGNYHPHGESVIYPTLVRLAQDFAIRYPLVDGQGNFGSVDGDPPAAMRYTEARMTALAVDMMEDLKRETVDFVSNYEETREEPVVLPGRFPNLLCNGSSGIAVGMATSIPPHNLAEVCDGLLHLLDNPQCTARDLLNFVKGPDFPTGGIVRGRRGIIDGYTSGRGKVILEARMHVEKNPKDRDLIVVTEIPYQITKLSIIEKMADLVREGVLTGINDIRDESSRLGMRLVIECKKDEDPEVVQNLLLKHTPLRSSFSIINIALVNQRPQTLDLKAMMTCYRDHRIEVIRRRTRFLLNRAEERAHIVEGLRRALMDIDRVVALIRASKDPEAARSALMQAFKLSIHQANAILEMRLQRLTGLEIEKLEEEYRELIAQIEDYKSILAQEARVISIIRDDVKALRESHADKRHTEIAEAEADDLDMEDLIARGTVAVAMSQAGYIKRIDVDEYKTQRRGGRGVAGMKMREGDYISKLHVCGTHDWMLFFSNRGRVHWRRAFQIPEGSRTSMGRALVNLLNLEAGETITTLLITDKLEKPTSLFMATSRGVIKRSAMEDYSNVRKGGIQAIKLDEGDSLVDVVEGTGEGTLLLATKMGQIIRFQESKVREMGRVSHGVGGIDLAEGDEVIAVLPGDPRGQILTVCQNGYGKRTPLDEYRVTGRNGKGIINIDTGERNGPVIACLNIMENEDILMISSSGMVVRTSAGSISSQGRNTQGVRLVNLKDGDTLVSAAKVEPDSDEDGKEPS